MCWNLVYILFFFADIPRDVYRQKKLDGSLEQYTCKHCDESDPAEVAIRRDYVHGYSVNTENATSTASTSIDSIPLPQAESTRNSFQTTTRL